MPWTGRGTLRTQDTGVPCPGCGEGTLLMRASCLQTRFLCTDCETTYDLGELAKRLDSADFTALAEAVGSRLSDRV